MLSVKRLWAGLMGWVLLCALSASPAAALDLVPDARLELSGVADSGGMPMDQVSGRRALRDGDPDTAWIPAEADGAWIELHLVPRADSATQDSLAIALSPVRVEIDWGDQAAATVTITAGPDRETQGVIARVNVADTQPLVMTPAVGVDDARVMFIRFTGPVLALSELRVIADDLTSAQSAPSCTAQAQADGRVELTFGGQAQAQIAHHIEWERTPADSPDSAYRFTTLYPAASDRVPLAGDYRYRARAIAFDGDEGAWCAAVTLTGLVPQSFATPAKNGVVEGFYGPPWSARTRLDTIRQLGVWGFNTYIYAPKKADKHCRIWRQLYTDDELIHFADLLAAGAANGVDVVYGISPGLTIDPLSDADFGDLTAKLSQLLDLGYTQVALLLDDIDVAPDATSGADHALLVNRLRAFLDDRQIAAPLYFVPTVYAGTPGRLSGDERAYLAELAAIDADVLIAWTGKGTFDEAITADEAEAVADLVGHRLWLWDNYPVNDFNLGLGMYLGAVRGRGADLLASDALAGVMVNPMIEGYASWFALASWAELLADPAGYDPDAAMLAGLARATDSELSDDALLRLRDVFTSFQQWEDMEDSPLLAEAIAAFTTQLTLGSPTQLRAAADGVKAECMALLQMITAVQWAGGATGLGDDLAARLEKLQALVQATLLAVDLLQADLFGSRELFLQADAQLATLLAGPLSGGYPISDDIMLPLIELAAGDESARQMDRLVGQARVEPIVAVPVPQARVGQRWYWDAGFRIDPDGMSYTVTADASIDASVDADGLVQLLPGAPGRFWIRVDAERDEVSVTHAFLLTVVPALNELAEPTLPMTTELTDIDGVPVLLQNGVVVPDVAVCQYSRSELAGVWKKRRMALDHRLSFAARSDAVIAQMQRESRGAQLPDFDARDWNDMTLPAVENRMPPTGHPGGPEKYWEGVWYRREVPVPQGGKDLRLVILAASYIVDVWADGLYLGWHEGGYTPAYFPLPDTLSQSNSVTLTIRVDRPRPGEMAGMLPHDPESDWWHYAGVVQDIFWEYLPADKPAAIARAAVVPLSANGSMQVDVVVQDLAGRAQDLKVRIKAFQTDPTHSGYWSAARIGQTATEEVSVDNGEAELSVQAGGRAAVHLDATVRGASLWEPLHPRLYLVRVILEDADGATLDQTNTPTGFRKLELRDDGKVYFNGERAFWPGIARHEDSADSGRTMTWRKQLDDLQRIKAQGAWMLRAGHYPNHPDMAVIADRLGLLVMQEIPAWWMSADSFAAQKSRGLALQMWRELIFTNASRPSVVLWGTCNECRPVPDAAPMTEFIQTLHDDLDTHYPDGRLVTQSLAANWYDLGGKETAQAVDVLGVTTYFGIFYGEADAIETDTAAFLEAVHTDYPLLPVLLTEFGAWSDVDASKTALQMQVMENVWDAVQPYAQVNQKKRVQSDGFVIGMNWWTMFDWYTNGVGLQTMGLYQMERTNWKPVAESLRDYYRPYTTGPTTSDDSDNTPVNRLDDSGCKIGGSGELNLWLVGLLCMLAGVRTCRRRFGLRD